MVVDLTNKQMHEIAEITARMCEMLSDYTIGFGPINVYDDFGNSIGSIDTEDGTWSSAER